MKKSNITSTSEEIHPKCKTCEEREGPTPVHLGTTGFTVIKGCLNIWKMSGPKTNIYGCWTILAPIKGCKLWEQRPKASIGA